MSPLDEAGDRLATLQMNAELRHAQLEMLSAQCATDRIRLRYSVNDVAQHAQREILRKAWTSASALYEYYRSIAGRVLDLDETEKLPTPLANEEKLEEAVARAADSLRAQRELFRPNGLPLDKGHRQAMRPFFSDAVLDQARIVSLEGKRVPNPPFYVEARAAGIKDFPDVSHIASLTFEDVLVFLGTDYYAQSVSRVSAGRAVSGPCAGTLRRTLYSRSSPNSRFCQRASPGACVLARIGICGKLGPTVLGGRARPALG